MNLELQAGTVVVMKSGKTAEDRWQITGPLSSMEGRPSWYPARRWIKKNKRWSSNAYCISPERIIRVE